MKFEDYEYLQKKIVNKAITEILLSLDLCMIIGIIFDILPINYVSKQLLMIFIILMYISFGIIILIFYRIKMKLLDKIGIDIE